MNTEDEEKIICFTAAKELRDSLNKAESELGPFDLYNELIRKATEIKARVRPKVA